MGGTLVYPATHNKDTSGKGSSARVTFKSYKWETAIPALAVTQRPLSGPSTSTTTLYLPGDFSEKYGASWGEEEMALLTDGKKAGVVEALNSAASKLELGGIMATAKYRTGSTQFPGLFMTFKQADPTQLSFNFDMLARNKSDSSAIQQIIANFKTKLLPEFTGVILKYPDIWGIYFTGINGPGFPFDGNEKGVGRYMDMALVGCDVSYSGGQQSALVFSDKNPVNVKMSLSFKCVKHSYINTGS